MHRDFLVFAQGVKEQQRLREKKGVSERLRIEKEWRESENEREILISIFDTLS